MTVTWTRHLGFLIAAIVVEAIVFLGFLVPFALPRVEAWQAGALLLFFASFV
jgi:hypothetical protein